MITTTSEHVKVAGHIGHWHTILSKTYEKEGVATTYHLMEHETYGDEAAMLILDSNGNIVLSDVYNGFEDLEYVFESDES